MIFARRARLAGGWAENVRVSVAEGRITAISQGVATQVGDTSVDLLLPALSNLHSHAFQRAIAGLTEHRTAGQDSFWTWRSLMYRFANRLTPDQVEAIAQQVQLEMLEAGYAAVGEFHYLHHQPGGASYDDPAEMSARIMAAAARTGIGLTHLPVLYSYGGAGRQPLADGQCRFGNDRDAFLHLLDAARGHARHLPPDAVVGVAPHSLRATDPEGLGAAVQAAGKAPIHIHIAEQPAEVAEVEAWLGARPVDWLVANQPVDRRWCAIHATHMTGAETARLARSGAVAGLCPITEANLGDGPFNGPGWIAEQGAFGIGSDSNVRISLVEELRTVEYSQRLRDLARNVMVPGEGSVGAFLYIAAAEGGARALGRDAGRIEVGRLADLVALDGRHPTLCALTDDRVLDGLVFAAPDGLVTDVWAAGRHRVQAGRHPDRDRIRARFVHVMADLAANL